MRSKVEEGRLIGRIYPASGRGNVVVSDDAGPAHPPRTHRSGSDHVWAVPLGENGWQVEVERFLLDLSHDDVVDLRRRRRTNREVDESHPHPLPGQLLAAVRDHDWIAGAWLRIREEGHVFAGELLVVPAGGTDRLTERLEALGEWVRAFDWRMHDLVVAPVSRIEQPDADPTRAITRVAGQGRSSVLMARRSSIAR